jgi:hypothetical protein
MSADVPLYVWEVPGVPIGHQRVPLKDTGVGSGGGPVCRRGTRVCPHTYSSTTLDGPEYVADVVDDVWDVQRDLLSAPEYIRGVPEYVGGCTAVCLEGTAVPIGGTRVPPKYTGVCPGHRRVCRRGTQVHLRTYSGTTLDIPEYVLEAHDDVWDIQHDLLEVLEYSADVLGYVCGPTAVYPGGTRRHHGHTAVHFRCN